MSEAKQFASMEEAEEERLACLEEIQDIERQLAERAAAIKNESSMRFVPDIEYAAYLEWRKRAVAARFHLLNQMRDAKEYVRSCRRQEGGGLAERFQRLRVTVRELQVQLDDMQAVINQSSQSGE